jgi:hypothetical protein
MGEFSVNGRLQGTVAVYDAETNEYIVEVHCSNWSSTVARRKSIDEIAMFSERTVETVTRAVVELMRLARRAEQQEREIEGHSVGPGELPKPHDRQQVELTGKELFEWSSDAWGVLKAANRTDLRFFNYQNKLADIQVGAERAMPSPRLLDVVALKGHLVRFAQFTRRDQGGNQVIARPPKELLEDMLGFAAPPLPVLERVVASPYCTAAGEIVTEPGYNEISRFLLHSPGLKLPALPDDPSYQEVQKAKTLLRTELLGDFPFVTDSDAAHAIAAMVSPIVRPMVDGPTPFFMFEAPTQGTGKDRLANAVTWPVIGRKPSVMSIPAHNDELAKKLTSILWSAPQVVLLDNIDRMLNSDELAAILTETEWTDRQMRTQSLMTLKNTCTWMGTANNPEYSIDIARRTVRCRIDTGLEKPWERSPDEFRHPNLEAWVRENRPELLHACLVLVRAWVAAGKPEFSGKPLGSFEAWSYILGGILDLAGFDGFLANSAAAFSSAARDVDEWKIFAGAWWGAYGEQNVTTSKLLALAAEKETLLEIRSGRTSLNATVVMGQALARMRDRVLGRFVVRTGAYNGGRKRNEWRLEQVSEEEKSF